MKEPQFDLKRPIESDSSDVDIDHSTKIIDEVSTDKNEPNDGTPNDTSVSTDNPDETDKPTETDKPDSNETDYSKLEKVTVSTDDGDLNLYVSSNGDYINEKGEVVYTKDQLEEPVDEYEEFFKSVDIKITDDNGNVKEYDKSLKGLSEYAKDVYSTAVSETLKSNNEDVFKQSLFENYPVLKDVIEHLDKKGSLEDFDFNVDIYSELKEDDKSIHRALIRKDKLSKGDTLEEVEEYISYLEDKGKLFDTAKIVQSKFKTQKQQEEQLALQKQQEDHINTWGLDPKTHKPVNADNSVYDIVFNKGKLRLTETDQITIPDKIRVKSNNGFIAKTRSDFFKFLYDKKPYKDSSGKVAHYTDYEYLKLRESENKNINHELYDAYKSFVGYDPLLETSKDTDTNYKNTVKKLKVKTSNSVNSNTNKQLKLKRQINN